MPTKRTPPQKKKLSKIVVTPTSVVTRSKSPNTMSVPTTTAALPAAGATAPVAVDPNFLAYIQSQDRARADDIARQDRIRQEEREDRAHECSITERQRKEDQDNLVDERIAQQNR